MEAEVTGVVPREVLEEIDRTVKETWLRDIIRDYDANYMLQEDTLKCCLYYHLRRKLKKLLRQYNLRILTEVWFRELRYRADMAIVELAADGGSRYPSNEIKDVLAIFELKFTGGNAAETERWIRRDVWKLKDYIQSGKHLCQYYFAVIHEGDRRGLNWLDRRSTEHWAKGLVTELDAGRIDGELWFEVNSYNGMNEDLND